MQKDYEVLLQAEKLLEETAKKVEFKPFSKTVTRQTYSLEITEELRKLFSQLSPSFGDQHHESYAIDFGYMVVSSQYPGISCIGMDFDDDDNEIPRWAEGDQYMLQIAWRSDDDLPPRIRPYELTVILSRIFTNFDCTGCCDAIEYVKMGPLNILIKINSGRTYHS